MKDGLYRVQFQTPLGWGAGVLYASGGRLWGGDGAMFYVGTYKQEGNNVVADVRTNRHTQVPGVASVFGRDQVRITLSGIASGDKIKLNGRSPEAPNVTFTAELMHLSD